MVFFLKLYLPSTLKSSIHLYCKNVCIQDVRPEFAIIRVEISREADAQFPVLIMMHEPHPIKQMNAPESRKIVDVNRNSCREHATNI